MADDPVCQEENCERKAQWRVNIDGVMLTQNYFGLGENSTGGALWDSSIVLWEKVRTMDLASRCVLELGSGVGFLAIKLAASGANVVATDGDEEALPIFRANVKRNTTDDIPALHLKWGDNETLATFRARYPKDSHFDYVMGADLIFNADYHEALLQTLNEVVVSPATRLLMAYRIRDEEREETFVARLQGHFTLLHSEVVGDTDIVYMELQRRA
ncbi:hypothetical protein ACHHYP_20024 [Achlya hypogyna]|uniref:Uncharacterized protein n=1 Tax=Achlya hypogyna TaxID=1202772 RepID=A0A1V9ZUD1_ACHHY|nr:hypothetical protein ACHHYP_20024 [Achlya hypogyna]